jgi:hypothetical protein
MRLLLLLITLKATGLSQTLPAEGNRQMRVTNPVAAEGISIILPSALTFNKRLTDLLDDSAIQKLGPLMPRTLIVVNDSGRYLAGLTVIFTYPERIAPAGTPWKYITNRTAHRADHKAMIAPGDVLLFTPLPGFYASFRPPANRLRQPLLDESIDRDLRRYEDAEGQSRIEAAIDSIIFDDGTLVGPDSANRLESLNNKFRANDEILGAVDGRRGEDLHKKLLVYSNLPPYDKYTQALRWAARSVLLSFEESGESAARDWIEAMRVRLVGPIKRRDQ